MNYERFEQVRKEQYPITETFAYLDTGTSGMVSRRAKEAMVAYLEERFENAVTAAKLTELFAWADALRGTAAKLFHDFFKACHGELRGRAVHVDVMQAIHLGGGQVFDGIGGIQVHWLHAGMENVHFTVRAAADVQLNDIRALAQGNFKGFLRVAGNIAAAHAAVRRNEGLVSQNIAYVVEHY